MRIIYQSKELGEGVYMSTSILQDNKEKFAELQRIIDEYKDKEGP